MGSGGESELSEILKEVRRIDVQSSLIVKNLLAGGYTSVFRGVGLEFDGVREYAEGDDPRSVDWNVTARVGRPFVKKYREERELTVLFALDLSASMGGGLGTWSSRQAAARVCACLALSAEMNNDKVGLIAFGQKVEKFVPAKRGIRHALRIVRDCLVLRSSGSFTSLDSALAFAARVLRRRAVVIVLSDFLSTGWQDALRLCARRHDVVAVRLLPPEFCSVEGLPATGLLRVREPESGRATVVDFGHPRVRASFAARVEAWRVRTMEELRRAKVDLMDVPIPFTPDKDAVARPILRFFRMRELRGAKR